MSDLAPSHPPARKASRLRVFLGRLFVPLLRLRVWLTEGPAEFIESTYFWAALVGLCGAVTSVAFREALTRLQYLFLRSGGPLEGVASDLPWWGRVLVPTCGGLAAGAILLLARRWSRWATASCACGPRW
jgi:hypothetical protein